MTSKKNISSTPAGQQRSLRSLAGRGWQPRMLALTLAALFAPVGGFAQDSTAVEETATLPRISVVGTSSEFMAEVLGEQVFEHFLRNKRADWEDYRAQVTPYELKHNLGIL